MINEETVEFFNNRMTYDLSQMKTLTVSQRDRIKHYGSQAEALLKNKDLAMFIHHYKFQLADEIASIRGHQPDDDRLRVALGNSLSAIDDFINTLKRAVYLKNKLGNADAPDNLQG